MKKFLLFIPVFALSTVLFSCTSQPKTNNTNQQNSTAPVTEAVYTCPMHPEVKSDKPGSCPKCGMDLEKVDKK